jgi:hypothetical protein
LACWLQSSIASGVYDAAVFVAEVPLCGTGTGDCHASDGALKCAATESRAGRRGIFVQLVQPLTEEVR